MRNLYSVLHVAPQASGAEIKAAFRHLAKACHPDVKPGDAGAEAVFQEVERAYKFLSNPETRKVYDAFLAARRAAARRRLRRAAATMSATCILTSATVLLAMIWLQDGSLSAAGVREFAERPLHAGTADTARVPAPPPERHADAATGTPTGP